MQVIAIDNFARENVSDRVIEQNLTQEDADAKAAELNRQFGGPHAPRYYVVKPDSYMPYVFEP